MADKKVVAIAGASSGTGRAMAEILAEQGYPVALAARREDLLKEIAVSITAAGGRALPVQADMGVWEQAQAFIECTVLRIRARRRVDKQRRLGDPLHRVRRAEHRGGGGGSGRVHRLQARGGGLLQVSDERGEQVWHQGEHFRSCGDPHPMGGKSRNRSFQRTSAFWRRRMLPGWYSYSSRRRSTSMCGTWM